MAPQEVTLYSCPTGGWVMGNRFVMEKGIKESLGKDCTVRHKVGCPLTAVVEIDGKSKREFMPLSMIVPFNVFGGCFGAASTGKIAKSLAAQQGSPKVEGSPSTAEAM